MKHRIITNGLVFRIQKRSWFIWRNVTERIYDRDASYFDRIVDLPTKEHAEGYIKSLNDLKWRVAT